jgi:dienelactone hydrolase
MKILKIYWPILILAWVKLTLQTAWCTQTLHDIDCTEQVFNDPSFNRKTVRVARYAPDHDIRELPPAVVFFHGGPGIQNEGQFNQFISQFTAKGYKVYVPEIIGSSYYATSGMDANEYKRNYCTDIQAVLNFVKGDSSGKIYAITHSLGCHQLFHFMVHPQSKFNLEAVCAIAGPWDVGANRLNAMAPTGKYDGYETAKFRITHNLELSHVGCYVVLENHESPMTGSFNPVVNEELNKNFSVLYNVTHLPKTLPVLLVHAQDDAVVHFSLSLCMFKALKDQGHPVSCYFLSTDNHGFIKNPLTPGEPDAASELREKAAENMLNFFETPHGSIYFDNHTVELESISLDRDIREIHKEFLVEYNTRTTTL